MTDNKTIQEIDLACADEIVAMLQEWRDAYDAEEDEDSFEITDLHKVAFNAMMIRNTYRTRYDKAVSAEGETT